MLNLGWTIDGNEATTSGSQVNQTHLGLNLEDEGGGQRQAKPGREQRLMDTVEREIGRLKKIDDKGENENLQGQEWEEWDGTKDKDTNNNNNNKTKYVKSQNQINNSFHGKATILVII